MSKNNDSAGFMTALGRWMNLAVDCNQAVVESALEQFTKPHKQIDAAMGGLSSLVQSILSSDPGCVNQLIDNQLDLMSDQLSLMETTFERLQGKNTEPVIRPALQDRRFMDEEWSDNPFFDFIKQSYLLNHRALTNMVDCLSLADKEREKVEFYLRQLSSALAPTNFPLSNPEIVRKIQESNGESLYKGVELLIEDQKKSGGLLNVCMSRKDGFELGKNLACTPGSVVYENELFQLIQYNATQTQVQEIPLLFVPSWVNKYYVYDLQEKNSLVKWAVDQGFSVFMMSWVNPDASHAQLGFDDYVETGLLTALQQVKQIAGVESVNCVGYCLGGALLAAGAAYLAARQDTSIHALTYLATSFDFTDPGDIRVMIDDYVIDGVCSGLEESGYLDGRALAVTFSLFRENELYWNYYIQNYLKGERPGGFDILHWNTDSTNLTARMHKFVLQKLVQGNAFLVPEGLPLLGKTVHLSDITVPVYMLATEKDHIARWQSCFAGARLHPGESRFVLAGSGHIAGVINSTHNNKYHYYTNTRSTSEPEQWLDGAYKHEGSWWYDWQRWLQEKSGNLGNPLEIAADRVVEAAPGRYVRRRLDEVKEDGSITAERAA